VVDNGNVQRIAAYHFKYCLGVFTSCPIVSEDLSYLVNYSSGLSDYDQADLSSTSSDINEAFTAL
jgi:hypothetical protein